MTNVRERKWRGANEIKVRVREGFWSGVSQLVLLGKICVFACVCV